MSKDAAETSTEVTATRLLDTELPRPSDGRGQPEPPTSAPSAPDIAPTAATAPLGDGTTAAVNCGGISALASGVAGSSEPTATNAAPREQDSPGRDTMAGEDPLNHMIVVTPAPDELIPRGLPRADLLAHVLVGTFADKRQSVRSPARTAGAEPARTT